MSFCSPLWLTLLPSARTCPAAVAAIATTRPASARLRTAEMLHTEIDIVPPLVKSRPDAAVPARPAVERCSETSARRPASRTASAPPNARRCRPATRPECAARAREVKTVRVKARGAAVRWNRRPASRITARSDQLHCERIAGAPGKAAARLERGGEPEERHHPAARAEQLQAMDRALHPAEAGATW